MKWQNQAVFPLVIINASGTFSGLFVYSPAVGLGNLLVSITAQGGTDPYGNAYLAGITSYSPSAPVVAVNFSGANQGPAWYTAPGHGGPYTLIQGIFSDVNGNLTIPDIGTGVMTVTPHASFLNQLSVANANNAWPALLASSAFSPGANQQIEQISAFAAGDSALGLLVTGDTVPRLLADSRGKLSWGPGGVTAADTTLGRSTFANVLELSGGLAFDQRAAPATPGSGVIEYANTDGTLRAKGSSGADVMLYGNDGLNLMSALGFQNGWTAGARVVPQYRHWYGNEIELLGSLVVPAGFAAGQAIVTLPVGYRPANTQSIWGADIGNNNPIRFNIGTAGGFNFGGPAASTAATNTIDFHGYVSLDA